MLCLMTVVGMVIETLHICPIVPIDPKMTNTQRWMPRAMALDLLTWSNKAKNVLPITVF